MVRGAREARVELRGGVEALTVALWRAREGWSCRRGCTEHIRVEGIFAHKLVRIPPSRLSKHLRWRAQNRFGVVNGEVGFPITLSENPGGDLMAWLKRNVFVLVTVAIMVSAIGLAVNLLHPVLSISPTDENAVPALAAAIAVTGVLTAAAATLTGALLKQSIDLRTTALAEQAADRATADQQRLLMETALQTVKLLGSDQGSAPVVRGRNLSR